MRQSYIKWLTAFCVARIAFARIPDFHTVGGHWFDEGLNNVQFDL
jgi:hypothetical protein